jgi:hypothetical protein
MEAEAEAKREAAVERMAGDFSLLGSVLLDVICVRMPNPVPANGETDVYYQTNVLAQFTKRMDVSTINTTTVKMSYVIGTQTYYINGSISYDSANFRVTFDPSVPLTYLRTYNMTVYGGGGGVKDVYGTAWQNQRKEFPEFFCAHQGQYPPAPRRIPGPHGPRARLKRSPITVATVGTALPSGSMDLTTSMCLCSPGEQCQQAARGQIHPHGRHPL